MELGRGSVGRGSARRYGTGKNLLSLLSQKAKRYFYSSSKLKTVSLCITCYEGMKLLKKLFTYHLWRYQCLFFSFLSMRQRTFLARLIGVSGHRCECVTPSSLAPNSEFFLSHTSLFGVFGMMPSPQTYVDVDRAPTPTTGMSLAIALGPWPPYGRDKSTFMGEHTYIYYSSHIRFH
jgi:hypothetical protein